MFRLIIVDERPVPKESPSARLVVRYREALHAAIASGRKARGRILHETRRPEADWRRLVASARGGDPEPWRDALRAKFAANDPDSLAEFGRMTDDPKLEDQPAPGLLLLARQLKYGCGDNKRAAQVLRRAAHRYPGDFRVHFELAQAPGTLDGSSKDLFPNPEEAVRHLASAQGIRPLSVTTHVVLSYAWIAYPKRDEAEAECREAVRLKPDDPWVHTALGNSLSWQKRFNEALVECREALRFNPSYLQPHGIMGLILRELGRNDEAEAEFREAIRHKWQALWAEVEALRARAKP